MTKSLLGSGVYDAREAGRLLAERVERIVAWATPAGNHGPAIVAPSLGQAFSFLDLVSLAVVRELSKRHVAESDLRSGATFLKERTGSQHPLADRATVERLATSGSAWLAYLDDGWCDIAKRGQGAFDEVVRLYLKRVSYDDLGVARLWRPARLVLLDPKIQAGVPCVEGTRVPTETIAAMVKSDSVSAVADEFDLTIQQIKAAVTFEARLHAGRGIAA